jgi:hypothetical protein
MRSLLLPPMQPQMAAQYLPQRCISYDTSGRLSTCIRLCSPTITATRGHRHASKQARRVKSLCFASTECSGAIKGMRSATLLSLGAGSDAKMRNWAGELNLILFFPVFSYCRYVSFLYSSPYKRYVSISNSISTAHLLFFVKNRFFSKQKSCSQYFIYI